MTKQAPDLVSEPRPIEVNALGVVYQIKLADGRDVAFETKLPNDCDQRDIDELMERLHGAAEKASARVALPKAREKVLMLQVRLRMAEEQFVSEETKQQLRWAGSKRQGEQRQTDAQRAALAQIMTTVAGYRADIPVAQWEVARLEAIIDGREPPALDVDTLKAAVDKKPAHPRPAFAAAE